MSRISIGEQLSAIWQSFFSLFQSPESIPGYILEAFTGWRRSRNWILLAVGLPGLISMFVFLGVAFLAAFRSDSSIVHACLSESDKRIPQVELERLAFDEHFIRNKIRQRIDPDLMAEETEEDIDGLKRSQLKADEAFSKSEKFRSVDLLLRRAQFVKPDSTQTLYRRALLTSVDLTLPDPVNESEKLMVEVSRKEGEVNPQAHAWLATTLLGRYQNGEAFDLMELEKHLSNAARWKLIEPELLNYYSEYCRANRKLEKALEIAKQAADISPKFNLTYARICSEMGPDRELEMKRAAEAAEKAYQPRRGTALETDLDRRALAESLVLQGRRDVAVEILKERLEDTEDEHISVRWALAQLYTQMFLEDNRETFTKLNQATEKAKKGEANDQEKLPEIDWKHLQEAAKLDANNASLGQTIAIQFRAWYQYPIPADLKAYLARQVKENKATTAARSALADLYLLKGRVAEARNEWEAIIAVDPYFVEALNNLAVFLCREKPPQIERAGELAARAVSVQPNNPEVLDTFGEVLLTAGQYADAIGILEKAIRADPTRINSRRRLAECYVKLGDHEMANEQQNRIRQIEEQAKRAREQAEEAAKQEALEKAKQAAKKASPLRSESTADSTSKAASPKDSADKKKE